MKKKIAIFISGRGSNMAAILQQVRNGILKNHCEVKVVFSNKAEARGLEIAREFGINTFYIESKGKKREEFDQEVLDFLRPLQIDFIVLAGFMRILSPLFIKAYRNKIINIHPADTTQFQGIGAYEWAFENKLKTTKVTVHLVDEGVDTGSIIAQKEVDLRGADTLEEVERRGLAVEHSFYSEALRLVFSGEFTLDLKE